MSALIRHLRELRDRRWVRGTSFVLAIGYLALLIAGQWLHSRHAGVITLAATIGAYLVWRWAGDDDEPDRGENNDGDQAS